MKTPLPRSALRLLVVLLATIPATACVYPNAGELRVPSTAFQDFESTESGRRLAERWAEHPGESGIYSLGSGLDAFAARALMIGRARHAIDFQYYIVHEDVTGSFLLGHLLSAAERGVRVRVLIDDIGSSGLDRTLAAMDAHENLEVRLFNPLARGPLPGAARAFDLLRRPFRLNHRMHNKLLTADGAIGVVGGRNIADEYFDAAEGANFADLDLLVTGPVLEELGQSFDEYWNSEFVEPIVGWKSMRADEATRRAVREELDEHRESASESTYARRLRGATLLRDVESGKLPLFWGPTHAVADRPEKVVASGDELEATLLTTRLRPHFRDAQRDLVIVSPYFIPRDSGVAYVRSAVERGARVRILTNSLAATDVKAVHAGYKRYRRALLEAGAELYELRPTSELLLEGQRKGVFGSSSASLHAKTFTFDEETIFVGSLNLDPRSVDLNTEIGVVARSEALARQRLEAFERVIDPRLSWRVALDEKGKLVWHGEAEGEPVLHTREPETSWWGRVSVNLLGLLPIEGQL